MTILFGWCSTGHHSSCREQYTQRPLEWKGSVNATAMRRSSWFCKACRKTAFPSEGRANSTVTYIRGVNPDGHIPTRAYECPHGNGWHLTSKERKTA